MTRKEVGMTRDQLAGAIKSLGIAMHERFDDAHGTHAPRLQQLDAALANVDALVGHLHDEEEREVDLAWRIVEGDTVHNGHPVRPPTDRPKGWAQVVAGRAAR